MHKLPTINVGEWVAITDDGIWCSPFSEARWSFKTKKAAIEDVADAFMDARRTPKVVRLYEGEYEYRVKDCDTGHFRQEIAISKVTQQNVERYNTWLREQCAEEEEELRW